METGRLTRAESVKNFARSLTLHTHPASRGKIVEWYAEELGGIEKLGLRLENISMEAKEQLSPSFLSRFPFGKLPALTVHGGAGEADVHLFESGALLLFLHDSAAAPSLEQRARAASWVLFANSTLANGLYLEAFRPTEMPRLLGGLQELLANQPFLEGEELSVADVAVGGLLLYLPFMFPSLDLTPWPAVVAFMARLSARPAYQRTLGARISGAASGAAPPAPHTRGGKPAVM